MNDTKLRQIRDYLDGARDLSPALIDAEGRVSRGNAHYALGEYAAALDEFQAAIRQRPSYVNAHFNAGVVLAAMDRFAEAEVEFRSAIDLADAQDVLLPEAYYYLAVALRAQDRLTEALCAVETATERGNDPAFAYVRAELHALAGDAESAQRWLKRAIVVAPRFRERAKSDDAFRIVRGDPGFAALLESP